MKISDKTELISFIIILVGWAMGIYFYQRFPEQVTTHWNFNGVADGYSNKLVGAFLMPAIMTAMYFLFRYLPNLDPKKQNYEKFKPTYQLLRTTFLVFFLLIFLVTSLANLKINIPINTAVSSLVGFLFIIIGSQMGKIEQNWFVGFRFPWTLSSENVWKKTNRFGGLTLVFFGGIMLLIPILPVTAGITLFIAGLLLVVFGTMIYSYLLFKKESSFIK